MSEGAGRCILEIQPDGGVTFTCAAWSPDGTRLAAGLKDGSVAAMTADGRQLWRQAEHSRGDVYAVAWSPDGRLIASGGLQPAVQVSDADSGSRVTDIEWDQGSIWSLAWSPDGRLLATAGAGSNVVRIWEVSTGRAVLAHEGDTSGVLSLAWSPDGRRIASAGDNHGVRLWHVDSGEIEATIQGHNKDIWSLAWSPDGRRLASGYFDGTVQIWDASPLGISRTFKAHPDMARSASWSPDSRLLAVGSSGGAAKVWDVDSGRELVRLEAGRSFVRSVPFAPDGARLATTARDGALRVWDVSDLSPGVRPAPHRGDPGWEYAARQAATVGRRSVWAAAPPLVPRLAGTSGDCLGVIEGSGEQTAGSVAVDPGGSALAVGRVDGRVQLWDLRTGAMVWEARERPTGIVQELQPHRAIVEEVAFSPGGRLLASASYDRTVRVWDARTGYAVATLEGHEKVVLSVAWSPDGRFLASASIDNTVRIWNATSGQCTATLGEGASSANSVAWSPDGRFLASASSDHTVRVWDAGTARQEATLGGHKGAVLAVAWSPDGRRLVSGAEDFTVRVWDAETGDLTATLQGHEAKVSSVAWSPDGRFLASASYDCTVRVWDCKSWRELHSFGSGTEVPSSGYAWRVAWAPGGGFLAASYKGDVFRLWDVRSSASLAPAPTSGPGAAPPRDLAHLPDALAAVHRAGLHPPLSLLRDLLDLTAGRDPGGPAATLAREPGVRALADLRWPAPARVGLAAWLLRAAPPAGWKPPPGLAPSELAARLAAALAGVPAEPDAPEPPIAALRAAAASVDDRLLTLLELLGPGAVAADPALPLRLAGRVPALAPMAAPRRRLLALRLDPLGGGPAQGGGGGGERAGVQRRGDPRTLLPSQLALPGPVLRARRARGELLYRARAGREPPRLRPAVLLLDVSPASFGPVEAVTRAAAHLLAATLLEAGVAAWLVTAGGDGSAAPLGRRADLVEIWTRRELGPADPERALARARGLAGALRGAGGPLGPVVVVLAGWHFGSGGPAGPVPGLRGLFVRPPGRGPAAPGRPAWAPRCDRWAAVAAGPGAWARLGDELAGLLE